MSQTLMLTGDVNLMNVADPAVPFKLVAPVFAKADFVFSNLECCFYIPPGGHSLENEGFFAEAQAAEALKLLIGTGEPLAGRLLMLDGRRMQFSEISMHRDPACSVCGTA